MANINDLQKQLIKFLNEKYINPDQSKLNQAKERLVNWLNHFCEQISKNNEIDYDALIKQINSEKKDKNINICTVLLEFINNEKNSPKSKDVNKNTTDSTIHYTKEELEKIAGEEETIKSLILKNREVKGHWLTLADVNLALKDIQTDFASNPKPTIQANGQYITEAATTFDVDSLENLLKNIQASTKALSNDSDQITVYIPLLTPGHWTRIKLLVTKKGVLSGEYWNPYREVSGCETNNDQQRKIFDNGYQTMLLSIKKVYNIGDQIGNNIPYNLAMEQTHDGRSCGYRVIDHILRETNNPSFVNNIAKFAYKAGKKLDKKEQERYDEQVSNLEAGVKNRIIQNDKLAQKKEEPKKDDKKEEKKETEKNNNSDKNKTTVNSGNITPNMNNMGENRHEEEEEIDHFVTPGAEELTKKSQAKSNNSSNNSTNDKASFPNSSQKTTTNIEQQQYVEQRIKQRLQRRLQQRQINKGKSRTSGTTTLPIVQPNNAPTTQTTTQPTNNGTTSTLPNKELASYIKQCLKLLIPTNESLQAAFDQKLVVRNQELQNQNQASITLEKLYQNFADNYTNERNAKQDLNNFVTTYFNGTQNNNENVKAVNLALESLAVLRALESSEKLTGHGFTVDFDKDQSGDPAVKVSENNKTLWTITSASEPNKAAGPKKIMPTQSITNLEPDFLSTFYDASTEQREQYLTAFISSQGNVTFKLKNFDILSMQNEKACYFMKELIKFYDANKNSPLITNYSSLITNSGFQINKESRKSWDKHIYLPKSGWFPFFKTTSSTQPNEHLIAAPSA